MLPQSLGAEEGSRGDAVSSGSPVLIFSLTAAVTPLLSPFFPECKIKGRFWSLRMLVFVRTEDVLPDNPHF